MRVIIKEYISIAARHLPFADPVFEFGALQVDDQVGFADLRPFFPGHGYVGCDIRPGPGVDALLDLHALALPDASIGSALVFDTLEHVEFCRQAVGEVHRVLRPNGIVLASSHMNFKLHGHPYDFWRFTPEGFRSLFRAFETVLVDWAGVRENPHTVVVAACKGPLPRETADTFCHEVTAWRERVSAPTPPSLGSRLLPPVLYRLDRRIVKRWRAFRARR
jgi:SAM-dependent methyltransferase